MPLSLLGIDGNPWTIKDMDASGNNKITTYHKLGASGSYTTAVGGDTLDLTGIAGLIPSGVVPDQIAYEMNGRTGSLSKAGGYLAIEIGTLLSNCKVQFWAAGGTEEGSGTYAAMLVNIAAEFISLVITWKKLSQ